MNFRIVFAPGLCLQIYKRRANPVVRRVQAGWSRSVALALFFLAVFVVVFVCVSLLLFCFLSLRVPRFGLDGLLTICNQAWILRTVINIGLHSDSMNYFDVCPHWDEEEDRSHPGWILYCLCS